MSRAGLLRAIESTRHERDPADPHARGDPPHPRRQADRSRRAPADACSVARRRLAPRRPRRSDTACTGGRTPAAHHRRRSRDGRGVELRAGAARDGGRPLARRWHRARPRCRRCRRRCVASSTRSTRVAWRRAGRAGAGLDGTRPSRCRTARNSCAGSFSQRGRKPRLQALRPQQLSRRGGAAGRHAARLHPVARRLRRRHADERARRGAWLPGRLSGPDAGRQRRRSAGTGSAPATSSATRASPR